jgi:hypothetical protein
LLAAAITAGTRRKLLQAALTAPDAIVSFATDGIVSEKPLKIATSAPGAKELGEWEHTKIVKDGGVFMQSGFYLLCEDAAKGEDGLTPKTRGFNPARAGDEKLPWKERLARIMLEDIPACWKEGKSVYEFDYWEYIGLGAAVQSPATETVIGCWKFSRRSQKLDVISRKRIVPAGARLPFPWVFREQTFHPATPQASPRALRSMRGARWRLSALSVSAPARQKAVGEALRSRSEPIVVEANQLPGLDPGKRP